MESLVGVEAGDVDGHEAVADPFEGAVGARVRAGGKDGRVAPPLFDVFGGDEQFPRPLPWHGEAGGTEDGEGGFVR